jgi:hypothetical protein
MTSNSVLPKGKLVPTGTEQMFVIETGDPAGFPLIFLQGGGAGCSGWTDSGRWHRILRTAAAFFRT